MDPAALKAQLAGMMGGGKMAPPHEGKGDEEEPPPPPAYVIHSAGSAADVTDFIAKKGNIHEVNEEGQTPLYSAALRKSDVMEALVRAGADIEKPDTAGIRPIQAAAWAGRGANCKCLILAKARVDENTFKPPSVGQALVYEVVDALISSGVSCQWVLAGVPTFHGILTKDLPGVAGVGVQDALPGQSAKRCGLQPGDVITAVNEQPIQNELALTNLLKTSLLADRWALTVNRPGEGTIEKDMVLGAVGYSWYNVDGVGLLREKERALAIKAEEEKEEFARQQKRATFEPAVPGVRSIVEKNVKKGKVQTKDAAAALKKKCPKGLGKTDLKTISENWEEEEGDTPTDLAEFVMFVCEQLDELGVDVPALAAELV